MAYNVPHVTLEVAAETSELYIRAGIIPLLISAPGVGKTTTATRIAKALNAQLRCIRLNNIPAEEVAGMQYVDRDGERAIHLPPRWMPNPDGSDGPVLILIDEITQAPDENRKAIMSALLERYLADTRLPDNCYFMACGNSEEDGTNVYHFDRATADRFGVLRVKTDVETWCNDYAPGEDVDITIVAFLRIRPDMFEMSAEAAKGDNVVAPSPRTWVAVDRYVKEALGRGASPEALDAGIKGKLGIEVGTAYMALRDQVSKLRTVSDLLTMDEEERRKHTPRTIEALWTYCQGLIWHSTTVERCQEAFSLLESFEETEGVPFYEMRFTIAEMILLRALDLHGLKDVISNKPMQQMLIKWRKQMNDVIQAAPDGKPVGETDDVALRQAA